MDWILAIVIALVSGAAGGAVARGAVDRRAVIWNAKREACNDAMDIATRLFSRYSWTEDGEIVTVIRQAAPTMEEIRHCHDHLVTNCRRPEVLEDYKKCVGLRRPPTGDDLDELRDSVRKELGLWRKLDRNRNESFLAVVPHSVEGEELSPPAD